MEVLVTEYSSVLSPVKSLWLAQSGVAAKTLGVEPFLEQEQMLDRRTRRLLLTVAVMCSSSAAFNSTQVSR